MTGVSCVSASLCVGTDYGIYTDASAEFSSVDASSDPTAPASWSANALCDGDCSNAPSINAVSCPSLTLCIGVDDGQVVAITNPLAGRATFITVDAHRELNGVSCPTASLCVAVDGDGDVLVSTPPDSAHWTVRDLDGHNGLTAVSCAIGGPCAAVDDAGNVLVSTDPTAGWSTSARVDDGLQSVSCTGAMLCVAGDAYGRVIFGTPAAESLRAG
ncbi:MAG: hypothetical protein ACLP50_14460 [Solirubrobacteraceae bacterium]